MEKIYVNNFIEDMKPGIRVKTSFGNGVIGTIIEDIHCSVNVLLDSGESKNIMLYDFEENMVKMNLNYE